MASLHVLWFKRDLRIRDHLPLLLAAKSGTVLPIYVFEPSVWSSPEYDASHFEFVRQSLVELDLNLRRLGGRLAIRIGELPDVFVHISGATPIHSIASYEETGTWVTYERDKRIARWTQTQGISWKEIPQNGVVRRLKNRDGWAASWARRMSEQQTESPERIVVPEDFEWGSIPTIDQVIPKASPVPRGLQRGGESTASEVLESFLADRGSDYRSSMSSPLTAESSCSRLSPYLTWGNLSVKQVQQATARRLGELTCDFGNADDFERKSRIRSLKSFLSRLSWHCHFIQKLESEPEIEFRNICRLYDGLREDEFNSERFEAWKKGETGFPMIDACMRYLHHHRWINFRMRAMLMSFAAYHLWLHWREPSIFLARQFLDFEPGIHFSQCQMQSGVTGINTIRIYSPSKQLLDQDPTGEFVRRWVPELEHVPLGFLAEPHRMSIDDQMRYRCRIGIDYPRPIVDDKTAVKYAKERIYAIRQTDEAKVAAAEVFLKHGSRKRQFRDPLPGSPTGKPASVRKAPVKRRKDSNDKQPRLPGMEDI